MSDLGRTLVVVGAVLLVVGLLMSLGAKVPLGRLPGDVVYRKGNFTFYFPLATSILISLVLTAIFTLLRR
jgi:Protein of unknown function (DUF2905)